VRVLTTTELRVLELNSEYLGVARMMLMENAGAAVARVIRSKVEKGSRLVAVCGPGNNGGDGMVAARHLAGDYNVTTVLLARPERIRSREARANWEALKSLELTVKLYVDPIGSIADGLLQKADVVIDAIFGTGLRGRIASPYKEVIEAMNSTDAFKVAVDVPSGLNPDTGEIHGVAVKADITVTFHAPKPGLLKHGVDEYIGELIVEPIGIPAEAGLICGPGDVSAIKLNRSPWSKKGDYGRILVVGGSRVFTGAPALAALASLRMGADLAAVFAPKEASLTIKAYSPNLIVFPYKGEYLSLENVDELVKLAEKFDVVVVGPGLGLESETLEAVLEFFSKLTPGKRLVVDADALKALARDLAVIRGFKAVLTPHAGELRIVSGIKVGESIDERVEAAKALAKAVNSTVLLKGHVDVITDGEKVKLNRTGNPGMTVGGTGDVLSGVTATLLSWSGDPFRAASAAAFINGLAGDLVALRKGYHILATDLLDALPEAYKLSLNPSKCREVRPPETGWLPVG